MTIQSYLVFPESGQLAAVTDTLRELLGCSEVLPADNRDLLVVVTETASQEEQNALEQALESLTGVACLAMVGGWSE